jgi:glycosyltransferase involved in cell wall biosynthesis
VSDDARDNRPSVPVSVFTASDDVRYLDQAYASLRDQSMADWEWIVLLGRKAPQWKPPGDDPRVAVRGATSRTRGTGGLKRAACELCSGELLVELDHGDLLASDCLAQVAHAFAEPGVVLAYSDFALIEPDGSPSHERFDADYGWLFTEATVDGRQYDRCHSLAPTPHNVGHIWYAPNHVRAFRRSSYDEVGGYNEDLEYLDDQELMSRLYLTGDFAQIKRCLYFQRVQTDLTPRADRINKAIQEQTLVYYRELIEDLTLAWAKRNGLRCLRLRTPIRIEDEPDERYEDVIVDPEEPRIDAGDNTAGLLKAHEVLQRMPKRAAFFNECHRVLAHAGLILTQTPSTDGRGAFQDPSHTTHYNENSFMYLTQRELHGLIPDLTARFQVSHLRTYFPTEAHVDMQIPYVQANLLAVKDGPRQGGTLLS